MPLFIWKPSYETHIPEIDYDHRQLVGLINELYEAMKQGQGYDLMNETLNRLIDYVSQHFETEEGFMRAGNYPGILDHQKEHQQFRASILEMDVRRRAGHAPPSIELLTYLRDWLRDHVTTTDKELGRYLKKMQN
ncbi:MAG: bacteriohemerythrin [Desulfuromonadales bacterium]|nr:bacteriohemerythrin [Desulfuromonadales bacterium]